MPSNRIRVILTALRKTAGPTNRWTGRATCPPRIPYQSNLHGRSCEQSSAGLPGELCWNMHGSIGPLTGPTLALVDPPTFPATDMNPHGNPEGNRAFKARFPHYVTHLVYENTVNWVRRQHPLRFLRDVLASVETVR